jgi:hypothetical protein
MADHNILSTNIQKLCPLKNGNIAANFPQYCHAFAVCMERLLPLTMKMSIDGKFSNHIFFFENEELATPLVCFG